MALKADIASPSLPPLANEGWDRGWPWDLMLDCGWLEGGYVTARVGVRGGWGGTEGVPSIKIGLCPYKKPQQKCTM